MTFSCIEIKIILLKSSFGNWAINNEFFCYKNYSKIGDFDFWDVLSHNVAAK